MSADPPSIPPEIETATEKAAMNRSAGHGRGETIVELISNSSTYAPREHKPISSPLSHTRSMSPQQSPEPSQPRRPWSAIIETLLQAVLEGGPLSFQHFAVEEEVRAAVEAGQLNAVYREDAERVLGMIDLERHPPTTDNIPEQPLTMETGVCKPKGPKGAVARRRAAQEIGAASFKSKAVQSKPASKD